MSTVESIERRAAEFAERYKAVQKQLGRVIVGHDDIVHGVLTCLFVGGHCLLEGVPGLGKTLLVRTLAQTLSLDFSRIQFTPDLMPADILGTNMIVEDQAGKREFQFQKGPIFTQICLADEINRATPKTQSALLEAMQEKSISIAGNVYQLKPPFFVMATQNPIEQEGTYPLPEAQLDRFFFKLVVGYSSREELNTIIDRTTKGTIINCDKVMDGTEIVKWQQLVREVILAPHVQDYVARLTLATHPNGPYATPITNQYLRWGSSPRGAQTMTLAAKVRALLSGRYNVSFEDVRRVFLPAMRHRVILNFEAEAEGIEPDKVLLEILSKVSEKADDAKVACGEIAFCNSDFSPPQLMPTTDSKLLPPDLMAQLERLELVTRKVFRGRMKGERRSKRKGQSVEFADFRSYVPGDDLRSLDWNLYARLDKLIIKLFLEEEDLHFFTLIDASGSMGFGTPTKLDYAKQLAAALGFVGLIRTDRVRLETLGQLASQRGPVLRGRKGVWRMLEYLDGIEPGETTSLAEGVKNFCLRNAGKGIVVLISDLMDKNGYETALRYLVSQRVDVYVIHVLSQEELDPDVKGDLKLVDCEDQDIAEITVSAPLLARYKSTLNAFVGGAQEFCNRRGMNYLLANNQTPVKDLIGSYLRRRGLVR